MEKEKIRIIIIRISDTSLLRLIENLMVPFDKLIIFNTFDYCHFLNCNVLSFTFYRLMFASKRCINKK